MDYSDKPMRVVDDGTPTNIYVVWGGRPALDNSNPYDPLYRASPDPSPPVHLTVPHSPRPHVLRFWAVEIISLITAAGFMAAIWILIARYDGHPLPEWSLPINLSTLVSLLAVGFRLAVISPVATVMGQQKWSWLTRAPRPLIDLQRIDSASHSNLGSAKLLLRGPRSIMAMCGAVTLILALAVGPVAQQALQTVPCQLAVPGDASVAVANLMNAFARSNGPTSRQYEMDVAGKAVWLNGFLNTLGNDATVPTSCSTGNCRFFEHEGVTYKTVGLCHACVDTSSQFTLNNTSHFSGANITSFIHASGLSIHSNGSFMAIDTSINARSTFTPNFTTTSALVRVDMALMMNASCADSPADTACQTQHNNTLYDRRPLAMSCQLQPCIQRIRGNITAGQLLETVVSSSPLADSYGADARSASPMGLAAVDSSCLVDGQPYDVGNFSKLDRTKHIFQDVRIKHVFENGTVNETIVSAPSECVYVLNGYYAIAVRTWLASMFQGKCAIEYWRGKEMICQPNFWLEKLWDTEPRNFKSIDGIMGQYATALSAHFRKAGTSLSGAASSPSNRSWENAVRRPALGTAYADTLCVSFAWAWLLWPLGLSVVAAALLVVAILRPYVDRDLPIWKDSPLPLLFYTMEQPVAVAVLRDENKLEERAGRMRVQFVREGELGVVRVASEILSVREHG